MVLLKIKKEELDGYRDYKIQLAQELVEENYTYTVLEKMLNPQFNLETVLELMGDHEWITLDVETYQVIDSALPNLTTAELNRYKKYLDDQVDQLIRKPNTPGPTWITPDPTLPNVNPNINPNPNKKDWSNPGYPNIKF